MSCIEKPLCHHVRAVHSMQEPNPTLELAILKDVVSGVFQSGQLKQAGEHLFSPKVPSCPSTNFSFSAHLLTLCAWVRSRMSKVRACSLELHVLHLSVSIFSTGRSVVFVFVFFFNSVPFGHSQHAVCQTAVL